MSFKVIKTETRKRKCRELVSEIESESENFIGNL